MNIITDGAVLTKLIYELKISEGKNSEELIHCLPKYYEMTDCIPEHLVVDSMLILMDWGLVEAYQNGKFLKITELKFNRQRLLKDIKFYISKQALDMEQVLGINLGSFHPSIFHQSRLDQRHFTDVFVLMSFDTNLKPIYDDHIKRIFEIKGLRIARADDFFSNGSIMSDIWSAIRYAKIIIADCTKRNANVFYEIGIAHTLGKETILIAQSIDDIPFDLRHLRIIIYDYTIKGMLDFEDRLIKTFENANNK